MKSIRCFLPLWLLLGLQPASALMAPADAWHLHRAETAAQKGAWTTALKAYEALGTRDERYRYNRANLLYRLGRIAEAAALYRQIESPALQHARYHNLGVCMLRLGKPRSALRYFRAALKFADDPATRTDLAQALKALKQGRLRSRKAKTSSDLRPGSVEGISDWERKEKAMEATLKKATIRDRTGRNNLAAGGTATRSRIGQSVSDALKKEQNGSTPLSPVALRHWEHTMEHGKLRTLLLPITEKDKGANDVPQPW